MKRKECCVCGSKEFELLYTFNHMPMYIGVSNNNNDFDMFKDQTWYICKKCGCIQLLNLIDLEHLYSISHNPGVGKTWQLHNASFSDYIVKYGSDKILEIGGGNGLIADSVTFKNKKVQRYKIYDVHCNKELSASVMEFNESFFDLNEELLNIGEFNTIVLSHTFEHLYEPVATLIKFHDILPIGGRVILSMPNIENGIIDKFTNALSFEHPFYIEEDNLDYMLRKTGFKPINISNFSKHNIFVVYEKTAEDISVRFPQNYKKNKKIFYDFVDHHLKNLAYLNDQIEKHKDCEKYLFGSHIFSQFLINFGLNVDDFIGILDDDINKQDHRLYGTKLMTYASDIIKGVEEPFIILQAGIYNKEIADKLLKINPKVKIIY